MHRGLHEPAGHRDATAPATQRIPGTYTLTCRNKAAARHASGRAGGPRHRRWARGGPARPPQGRRGADGRPAGPCRYAGKGQLPPRSIPNDLRASRTPQRVAEAAQYYHQQVAGRLKNRQARDQLKRWRESIEHKTSIVRLINLDTTPARLHAALQWHPSTRDSGRYTSGDLPHLADRLESEAQNELYLFLAQVYRLGFHRLLIYPIRPPAPARTRRRPLADRKAGGE